MGDVSTISKFRCFLFVILLGSLLSGCTSSFRGEVARFHTLEHPASETIRVIAMNPADRRSLQFRTYADQIAERLGTIGYKVVGADEVAELTAEIYFEVDDGRTEIRSWPRKATWYHFRRGYYYDPWYYGSHWHFPEVYSYVVFTRSLEMLITRTDGVGEGKGEVVFEGSVHSTGRSRDLTAIMPYMITAMFENFPGESGISKIVTIEED
jgi:hypothetical protein